MGSKRVNSVVLFNSGAEENSFGISFFLVPIAVGVFICRSGGEPVGVVEITPGAGLFPPPHPPPGPDVMMIGGGVTIIVGSTIVSKTVTGGLERVPSFTINVKESLPVYPSAGT